MGEKKFTMMVIKVDLECHKCTKKIKKILCGIPQIQSQIYDEKANTVTVTVVRCSPEKIKKKICSKGGDSIKGIQIKDPPKPKEAPKPEKPKEKPKEPEQPKEKPKEPEKPKEKPREPEKPKEKPKEPEKPKKVEIVEPPKEKAAKPKPVEPAPKAPEPQAAAPGPLSAHPLQVGGGVYYDELGSMYNYEGNGTPVVPRYVAYGRPVYDSWSGGGLVYYGGCGRGCCAGRCDCVREESPPGCTIM